MIIRIAGLLLVGAALAACSPAPGSAEWCHGVLDGKIKPTDKEVQDNDAKCGEVMMKDVQSKLGK
jgi:hypothetical protein